MFEINLDEALETLRKTNKDLSGKEFHTAVKLGLNDGIRKARTSLTREILKHFNETAFTPTGVRKALTIDTATNANLTATLSVSGKPIAMQYFSPRKNSEGISVEIIKGRRKVVRGSFFVKTSSGKRSVFAKGKYEGNTFMFRNKRIMKRGNDLPISRLLSLSIPTAIHSNDVPVIQNVSRDVEGFTMDRIAHHINQIRLGNR